jgi:outer membrane protein assembly factor BamB
MSGKESAGQMRSALLTQTRTVNQELVRLREDLQNAKASLATAAPTEQGAIRAKIDTIKEDIAGREQKLKAIQQSIQDYQNKLVQLDSDVKIARENLKIGQRWQTASRCDQALIRAGHTLFAGGPGEVIGVEAETGTIVWRTKVEGIAKGLAVANGRLLVSTDKGRIYAFGPAGTPQYGTVAESPVPSVNSEPSQTPISAQAEALLRESGVRRGYCLVHGCETGQLAVELARRSELMIYAVSPDAQKVAAARKTIDAAGLYGARICVEQWPVEQVPYGSYFANLVVSEQGSPSGKLSAQGLAEAWRLLKPQGGVALLPRAAIEGDTVPPFFREVAASIRAVGPWTKIVRGPLPGAGNWTHQYANPANTTCSDDQRLTCPLTVLWFGLPGPANMPSRHERAAAPLSLDGRVFCQGENIVMAFDAYNGLPLWERPLPGARRVVVSEYISNLAVCRDGLLVAVDNRCLRLDLATGKTLASYDLPPGPGDSRWGYLACDGTRIYGTRQEKPMPGKLSRRPSPTHHAAMVFALDLKSGQLLWTHAGSWIPHRSISLGDGRLYLVQDGVAPIQRETALEQRRQQIAQLPKAEQAAAQRALAKTEVRLVLALDPATGKVLWQQPLDVSFASGGSLATMSPEGRLVLFGVFLDGHYWKQFFAGDFSHRGVTVLAGNSGTLLWSRELGFRVRPLVIGDTLHAEPWAFDLHTGAQRTRVNPITGQTEPWQFARPGHHCGCPAASPHALFFRSWCLGYYDLVGDFGTQHFGAQRPGCWINFLPASGLLIMPEASTGCMCAFPNMTTVVFAPTRQEKNWSYYSASGPTVPVRRLALNMGAPGDRKDTAGNLWLGFPRPAGSLVLPLRMSTVMCPGGGYVSRNSTYTPIAGTSDPWLFTSAARGLTRCIVPLAGRADGTALYRVRLALADPDNDQPGQRVFQIKLQGKVICPACDIVKEAGGRDRALVKEFTGIEVKDALVLELVPRSPKPTPQQMPILQGLEIVRQRVISLGCTADPVVLNIKRLKHTTDLTLGNAREESFEGFLEIENLPNLKVAPARQALKLASGAHARLPIEIVATRTLPEGVHELAVKLVRGDGQVDTRSTITVEQLGRRERVVIPACEDAHVSKRFAQMNKGKADVLLVDGGDRDIGDLDHSLAFLKFRLPSGGKVVRAVLRLHNAGNATGDAGRLCLVEGTWNEERVTYVNRPALGPVVGRLGPMSNDQVVECPLDVDLTGKSELSLAIDPTSTDGVDFFARESSKPPELIIEYELPG